MPATLIGNIRGPEGPPGAVGPPGVSNAAYTWTWRWTTRTVDAANLGEVGIDTAAWSTATHVNINKLTSTGTDVSVYLEKVKVGDEFYLQDKSDSTLYGRYAITGLAMATTGEWLSYPVSYVNSGAVPPNNNAETQVSILVEGAHAEEWTSGAGVPSGSAGQVGDWYLQTDTGDVYEKTGDATWTLRTNIMGPPGPAGDIGTQAYRHIQATADTVWTITHGLPFRPNVTAVDSSGREMWPGAVDYPSATSVTLTFSAAVGGEAYLS